MRAGIVILVHDPKTALDRVQSFVRVAFHLVPILVICALWLAVLWAYHVPRLDISDGMVEQARDSPPDSVLEELKDVDFVDDRRLSQQELVDAASRLLGGELHFYDCSTHISMPFSAQDLDHTPPACDLALAGFLVPDILLGGYEATGRQEFLTTARDLIVGAQEYEQSAWLPKGEFWNDHAVAARVVVLANFWRLYRHSPGYQPGVARQVLQMASHSEQLLAKPNQFSYATNHGIMQNLALWHASLAFPSLPHTQDYQRLAQGRLVQQMKFYVSDEGVVLEHSAGYHVFGLELMGWAFRYLDLMHETPPEEWIEKYERAKSVYATLRRPDGSLPIFGDTVDQADPLGPLVTAFDQAHRPQRLHHQSEWKPAAATNVYPASGYAVWWDGLESWPKPMDLSQTVVTWSNFSGHAHKHADEMSLLFWAGGQTWLSNIGYWPYESNWRNTITSWEGANAPHLVGETASAPRTTRLVSSGSSDHLSMLELERMGVENYVARRQVIHLKPNLWLVLDSTSGSEKSHTSTTWTSASDVRWMQRRGGAYRLEGPGPNHYLNLFSIGSANTAEKLFRGSFRPFAGWQFERGLTVPASALVVEQPARNSWAATIWIWEKAGLTAWSDGQPQMIYWKNATDWELQLPAQAADLSLTREGNMLRLHSERGRDQTLALVAPSDISPRLAELQSQFAETALQYHYFIENSPKRLKITYLLLGIFLLQEILFVLYKRISAPHLSVLKYLNTMAWVLGGIWLVGFYF